MHPNNHKFISFEGIEGVGKSTNIRYIASLMDEYGQDYILTREPGGTPLAEALRQLLLTPHQKERIWPDTEILLLYAGRVQHLNNVIYPALKKGQWVLCDRFCDATFAYQGGGRQVDTARIQQLNDWALHRFMPAHTFLFDAPPEVGLARIQQRGSLDRIEQEKHDFFVSVRKVYLERAYQEPQRFKIINATHTLSAIHRELKISIQNLIAQSK